MANGAPTQAISCSRPGRSSGGTALAKRGQKVHYVVPWPSQNFFTKKPVKTMDDLKGVRMRTYDRNTAEMVSKLGMVPQQMNNPDIVPALASGRLDAVMTSGTTAAAQKYWEFLKHTYNTNHLWASNLMVINLGAWNKLSPENRAAIEKLAKEMEPEFWKVSEGEHAQRMAQLKQNGMTVDPASKELLDRGHVKPGDDLILTLGELSGVSGGTNTMKLLRVDA